MALSIILLLLSYVISVVLSNLHYVSSIAMSLLINFISPLPNCPPSPSLPVLRPVGWERRGWRTSCWMRTTTYGSPWGTNTLLRCQRELLGPNDRALTQAAVPTTGVTWLPPPQNMQLSHRNVCLVWMFRFTTQGCDSFSERILGQ